MRTFLEKLKNDYNDILKEYCITHNYKHIIADLKLNDWTLGRGVTNIELFMPASGKPKLKIECFIDEVDIKDVLVGPEILPLSKYFKNSKGE